MKVEERSRPAHDQKTRQGFWRRIWRISKKVYIGVGLLLVLLIALRLALPFVIKNYVNRQLNKPGDYTGKIGDVSVHLWRGAYRIHAIGIFKRTGKIPEPFFSARALDLSVEWKELFHGKFVGEVTMNDPRVNFVAGPTVETTQTGTNASWDQLLKSLFPFKLNRLEIKNGEIHFANHYSKPPVDIFISKLACVATNLTNAREVGNELPSGIVAQARTLGSGFVDLNLRMNLMESRPTFELTCQLTNVDLPSLNDFLRAYGKFDVARGRFALFASVASKDGSYDGYVKPVIEDLSVFSWEKEKDKNVLGVVWEAVVGMIGTIFRNHSQDTVATKVPISGTYEKGQVGVWTAVVNLLRNAFIQALVPKVDEKVTIRDAEKNAPKPDKKKIEEPPGSKAAGKSNSTVTNSSK